MNVAGANLTMGSVTNSGNVNFTNATGTITVGTLTGTGTTSFAAGVSIPTLSTGTINVSGVAIITTASGGTANLNGAMATIGTLSNTTVSLSSGTVLSVGAGTQTGGGITGSGSLTKTGAGTLILGYDNTYSGGTTISAGTLQMGNGGATGTIFGNVTDNGTLVFNRNDSLGFGGLISGTGAVQKSGTGTLTLTNNNSYSGNTTISNGTLQVSADNNLGGGQLAIGAGTFRAAGNIASTRVIALQNASSAIQVDSGLTYTAASGATVSGTGGLTKTGAGTLDLSAATISYTGTTTANAGTLNLGSPASTAQATIAASATMNIAGSNLVLGPLANSGNVNFTNTSGAITVGALTGSGTTTFAAGASIPTLSSGNISVAGAANITTASGGTANLTGATAAVSTLSNTTVNLAAGTALSVAAGTQTSGGISGPGSLTKTGSGTFIVGFDNTYTGGTTISAGTFQIGNAGAAGGIVGNVIDNGTLVFNRTDSYTFGGVVSGSGAVRQSGTGTLTLININTYTGGTTINSGTTLQLGNGIFAGGVPGNLTNNGSLILNTPAPGQTLSGSVSGTGSITKTGPGTQALTGTNTNSGGTTISSGILQVGDGGTAGSITGNVTDNAVLVFNRSDNVNFTGTITGSGRIEQAGAGTLTLAANVANALSASNGRVVIGATSTFSGDVTTNASGRVENGGGALHIANLDNSGILSGTADVVGTFLNRTTGDVRLAAGQSLFVQNSVAHINAGLVEVLGNPSSQATFETVGPLTNAAGGGSLIVARNASLRFDGGLNNLGAVAMNYGLNDIFGDVTNATGGTIAVAGGAGVTFYDDVMQNGAMVVSASGGMHSSAVFLGSVSGTGGAIGGGDIFFLGDLRPGNSSAAVTFANNVTFAGGALDIEIGGTALGSQYDHVAVTGDLSLGGKLKVSLINSFTPSAGQSFDVLDWGALSGTFSTVQLPALPAGLTWNTSQLYTAGTLSVGSILADFNYDGLVDTSDYIVWRKGLGTTYTQSDYDAWRAHFGQSSGSGSAAVANAAVPEPATLMLLMFAAVGWYLRRRRAV
jgi:autotransporter-associated beta strand protein